MKKKGVIIAISAMLLTVLFALTACSSAKNFAKVVSFDESEITKVSVSINNTSKEFTGDNAIKLYNAFKDIKLADNKIEDYQADWGNTTQFSLNFYLKDKEGYMQIALSTGIRSMDGFKYNKVKDGYYTFSDLETLSKALSDIYYRGV